MASKTLLFLAFFAATVSMILSIPQAIQNRPFPEMPQEPANQDAGDMKEVVIEPRTFNQLLNLSAYLQNAPNNSAALNFVPLITILSAAKQTG